MGLFSKKKKKEEEIPSLPELPKLPELPPRNKEEIEPIHQLPSIPNNSFGKKFSENTIKEAINGKKEGEKEFEAGEMEHPKFPMPQMSFKKPMEDKMHSKEIPSGFEEAAKKVKQAEPIFIRIDKFEESLKIFDKIKNQVMDIEKMLKDIKQIKEDEDNELMGWETEIKTAKEQIEKIDRDIFSKIE